MKNKQTPEDFNISDQNTKTNLFKNTSSRTFTMFLLALTLCISGFTITATAQQDGRRLQNSGDIASKNDSSEIPANSQPDSPEGDEDFIADSGFESSTGQFPNVVNSNWAQTSTINNPPLCGAGCTSGVNGPQQGSYYAFFGENTSADTSSIQQNNIRFFQSNNYVLRFQLKISRVTAPFNASLTVKIDGNIIHTITEPSVAQTAYSQVF